MYVLKFWRLVASSYALLQVLGNLSIDDWGHGQNIRSLCVCADMWLPDTYTYLWTIFVYCRSQQCISERPNFQFMNFFDEFWLIPITKKKNNSCKSPIFTRKNACIVILLVIIVLSLSNFILQLKHIFLWFWNFRSFSESTTTSWKKSDCKTTYLD